MLVLSRKKEEKIIIRDNIIIQVLGIRDGKVKLGITAPDNVLIVREEIADGFKKRLPSSDETGHRTN